ncbi:hypothetical protein [Clostridium oceanicum]|uniref:Uncharacterized protein n=1 Tax=Clostridium oceanicum TaxID=1543 RepID=A0ABN1JC66_9CLOT
MIIGKILEVRKSKVHKKLNKNRKNNKKKKKIRRGKENLSFSYYMEMMKHDSYYRGKGGANIEEPEGD